jgi:hypothetical protein
MLSIVGDDALRTTATEDRRRLAAIGDRAAGNKPAPDPEINQGSKDSKDSNRPTRRADAAVAAQAPRCCGTPGLVGPTALDRHSGGLPGDPATGHLGRPSPASEL